MAHGRISFSGTADSACAPVANSETSQLSTSGRPVRSSGVTQSIVSGLMPDIADQWIMDSIERKRASLHRVTLLERHRIEEFVDLLFDEDSDRCQEMVDAVAAECGDPQKVVERLFEPAARVIGENWCSDDCDFFKVTVAMARMQRLFRRLAAEFPLVVRPDMSRFALLAPAPGEQHMFGLSVVDDAFRRGGWEVDCCGCDEELEMYRLAASNNYRIIGISVSVDRLLADLLPIVRKLRAKSRNKAVVLIAGGSMVIQNPQGAIDAGFDLLAVDAMTAVALAESLFEASGTATNQRMAAE